jgi:hypothetical protein
MAGPARVPDRLLLVDDDPRPRTEEEACKRWAAEGALLGEPKFTAMIREQLAATAADEAFEGDALKAAREFLEQQAAAEAAKLGAKEARRVHREALCARITLLAGVVTDARTERERRTLCDALALFDAAEHRSGCGCRWCRSEAP